MIHQPASPFPSHFPASYDLIRDTSSPSNLSRSLSRGKSFANTIFNQLETTTTFDRNIFVKISTIQILQKSPKRQRHIEAKTRQFIKDILNGDVKDTLQLQIDVSQPVRTSSVKTWSMAKWLQMSLKSANSIFCSLSKPSRPVIFPISARIWRKISRLQFSQTTWTLTTSTKTNM